MIHCHSGPRRVLTYTVTVPKAYLSTVHRIPLIHGEASRRVYSYSASMAITVAGK
jgi:hypothetical protein